MIDQRLSLMEDKQADFLEALLGEVRGNIRAAMDIAGYFKIACTKIIQMRGQRPVQSICIKLILASVKPPAKSQRLKLLVERLQIRPWLLAR